MQVRGEGRDPKPPWYAPYVARRERPLWDAPQVEPARVEKGDGGGAR